MGLAIVAWIIFLAWLMRSNKSDKEAFLFYAWTAMISVGTMNLAFEAFTRMVR